MTFISELTHCGPHGSLYGQAVRLMISAKTAELRTSRKRALWTTVSPPRITTYLSPYGLVFFHSREVTFLGKP
jgi:hypothetical protein